MFFLRCLNPKTCIRVSTLKNSYQNYGFREINKIVVNFVSVELKTEMELPLYGFCKQKTLVVLTQPFPVGLTEVFFVCKTY